MKNTNKEFLNELREEITKDTPELPDSLKAEAITDLVKDETMKKKSNKAIYRITAAVACFAVVFVAGFIALHRYEPKIKTIAPSNSNNTDSVYTSEYAEIQDFFKSLRKKYTSYAVGINDYIFNYKNIDQVLTGASAENAVDGLPTAIEDASSRSFNETDTQVQGVLEADIIKNDGKYLYIVHQQDSSKVVIVDTKDPKKLVTAAKINLPETDNEYTSAINIFLYGDKLVILTDTYTKPDVQVYNEYKSSSVCCFAGSCGEKTGAVVYDISKKTAPKKVAEYALDGGYVTSRLTDSTLLLISNYIVPLYNDDKQLEKACIPSYFVGTEEFKIPANNIGIVEGNEENTYTVILKIDLKNKDVKPDATAVLGGTSDIYCSKSDLYLSRGMWKETNKNEVTNYTCIYRFDFTNGIEYKSSVNIPGGVLNQFSMDEYNGFFRVATSDSGVQSYITVLDKELNIIGQLSGIARGESIYAVRFIENTAYVVTFYQTDPLFVIDLSNPASPKITGELKIPGFSNMLFPYSENLLIGVGIDGDNNGTNGKVKVSLFDISDKANPKEISKAVIDGYSSSSAQYDHRAFMKFSDTGEFAIPIAKYNEYSGEESSFLCAFKVEDGTISAYKKYVVNAGGYDIRSAYTDNTVFVLSGNDIFSFDRESAEMLSDFKMLDKNDIKDHFICVY